MSGHLTDKSAAYPFYLLVLVNWLECNWNKLLYQVVDRHQRCWGNNGFLQGPLQCYSSLLFPWEFFSASMYCYWSWCQPNGMAVRKCFWSISTANTRNTLWNIFWGMFVDLQLWTSFSVLIGFLLVLVSINFWYFNSIIFLNSWLFSIHNLCCNCSLFQVCTLANVQMYVYVRTKMELHN